MLRRYIPGDWTHRLAAEITRRDVRNLVEGLADRIPVQANRVLALLRKVFNFGVEREIVPTSPCVALARPTREHPRERVLTPGEIRSVFAALGAEETDSAALVKLCLLTAQRGGELRTMEWAHLDLEECWWTIPPERTKNGLAHRVPLSPWASDILRQLRETSTDERWVFPVGRWHPRSLVHRRRH
jgi:integrase